MTPFEAARTYIGRGWTPVPVPYRNKAPNLRGWQNLRIGIEELSQHFGTTPQNVGVLLGEPSSGLVDIDLDCPEALHLVPKLLPKTNAIFGRIGKPRSHWLFTSKPCPKTAKFVDTTGATLLELRSTGCQTVFPGSVHPSGEPVVWVENGQPANIDCGELGRALGKLASAVILARHWPQPGSRHDAALALAGGLVGSSCMSQEEAELLIDCVANASGSDPNHGHAATVGATLKRQVVGGTTVGWGRLGELLNGDGARVVRLVRRWLGVRDCLIETQADASSDQGFACTELGNAKRMVTRFGAGIRYCHTWGRWLTWSGERWAVDEDGAVLRMAKGVLDLILEDVKREQDAHRRKNLAEWWVNFQTDRAIRAMVTLAQSETIVSVTANHLDRDAWLINCINGTLDLRTGELRPACPDDLITKLAPVQPAPPERPRFGKGPIGWSLRS